MTRGCLQYSTRRFHGSLTFYLACGIDLFKHQLTSCDLAVRIHHPHHLAVEGHMQDEADVFGCRLRSRQIFSKALPMKDSGPEVCQHHHLVEGFLRQPPPGQVRKLSCRLYGTICQIVTTALKVDL